MAIVERNIDQPRDTATRFRAYIPGRVLPHAAMMSYLMYFLSASISTVRGALWLFIVAYLLFLLAHTLAAARRIRFPVVAGATLLFAVLLGVLAPLAAPHSEAGSYTASVLAFFLVALLGFSCVNNYWFVAWRGWYVVELLLVNGMWTALAATSFDVSTASMIGLTLPVLVYSLYVLLYDYTFGRRLPSDGKRKLTLRWVAALLVLLLVALIGSIVGTGGAAPESSASYSLLSKKNDRFEVQDRAKLEDEFRIPLDSKELVFVANISPTRINGANIGASYLKFHSLYSYDPAGMEFNGVSDEFEAPGFRVRVVPLEGTAQEPVHVTVDADGRAMLPPYALRFDGRSSIYNVKLSTAQSFGHNLTYRFISYPATDSISVAGQTHPLLGVHRLFTKVSYLSVIPIGTAGQFFQFDLNKAVMDRVSEYPDVESAPRQFTQRYLNVTGLDQDIVDTMRALLRGRSSARDRIMAVIAFFTQKGEDGRNVFSYSLKPGKSPDPRESLLHYFLLKNRRGYCTYYATAATLFFRVAGIPSRVAVGFTPGEESEQNPGWFSVYSNQAHAWTEIYLGPTLGWIDVDLTPAGDGPPSPPPPPPTPPTPPVPMDAQFSLSGTVLAVGDSLSLRRARLQLTSEEQDSVLRVLPEDATVRLRFDTSIEKDGMPSKERKAASELITALKSGDSVVATGRRSVNPGAETGALESFTFHKIARVNRSQVDSARKAPAASGRRAWWSTPLPWAAAGIALLVLVFAFPSLHLRVLAARVRAAANGGKRLAAAREWLLLALHMQRLSPERETDLEFARRAGSVLGTPVAPLVEQYLQFRYSGVAPGDCRDLCIDTVRNVRASIRRSGSARAFALRLNLWEYIRFINRRKTA